MPLFFFAAKLLVETSKRTTSYSIEIERAMEARTISAIYQATPTIEGGGFTVFRPFSSYDLPDVDPFLLLDEAGPTQHAAGESMGLPDHPHRGFETFTYFRQGSFEGHDSTGFRDVFHTGDVEWTTAGRGIIHGGGPSPELQRSGGTTHLFQLWVNLPKAKKLIPPQTTRVPAERIPAVTAPGAQVRVLAGDFKGIQGPVMPTIPITYLDVTLQADAVFEVKLPAAYNAMVYVVNGAVRVGEHKLVSRQLAVFKRDGETVTLRADERTEFLVIAGEPLNEPVARRGPFVMNTPEEVYQAYVDYGAGTFRE
jgi:quercetin 2,3-dioxygenase